MMMLPSYNIILMCELGGDGYSAMTKYVLIRCDSFYSCVWWNTHRYRFVLLVDLSARVVCEEGFPLSHFLKQLQNFVHRAQEVLLLPLQRLTWTLPKKELGHLLTSYIRNMHKPWTLRISV